MDRELPLISVIVPVFNVEKYLDQCVQSIVDQTYTNLEIILVDDGSPDRCPQMCDEWAERDNRIHVIHQENQGQGAARNAGLDVTKGDLVGFVDSDDWIESCLVERCFSQMKTDQSNAVVFTYRSVSEDGRNFSQSQDDKNFPSNEGPVCEEMALKYLLTQLPHYSWSYLANKGIYTRENIVFPEGRVMEDVATTYRVFAGCGRLSLIHAVFYNYRFRKDSTLHSPSMKRLEDGVASIREVDSWLSQRYPNLKTEIDEWTVHAYLTSLLDLYEQKEHDLRSEDIDTEIATCLQVKMTTIKWSSLKIRDLCILFLFRSHLLSLAVNALLLWREMRHSA